MLSSVARPSSDVLPDTDLRGDAQCRDRRRCRTDRSGPRSARRWPSSSRSAGVGLRWWPWAPGRRRRRCAYGCRGRCCRPCWPGRSSGSAVVVDDGGVRLVNVFRTIRLPWPAIQRGRHQVGADAEHGLRAGSPPGRRRPPAGTPAGRSTEHDARAPAADVVQRRTAALRARRLARQPSRSGGAGDPAALAGTARRRAPGQSAAGVRTAAGALARRAAGGAACVLAAGRWSACGSDRPVRQGGHAIERRHGARATASVGCAAASMRRLASDPSASGSASAAGRRRRADRRR